MKKKKTAKPKPKVGGARMRELGSRRVEVWLSEDEFATVEASAEMCLSKVARFVREAALAEAHKVQLRYQMDRQAAQQRESA